MSSQALLTKRTSNKRQNFSRIQYNKSAFCAYFLQVHPTGVFSYERKIFPARYRQQCSIPAVSSTQLPFQSASKTISQSLPSPDKRPVCWSLLSDSVEANGDFLWSLAAFCYQTSINCKLWGKKIVSLSLSRFTFQMKLQSGSKNRDMSTMEAEIKIIKKKVEMLRGSCGWRSEQNFFWRTAESK